MSYDIEWEDRLMSWTFRGMLTGQDLIRANKDIFADTRFVDLKAQIVDFLNVEDLQMSHDEVRLVARMDQEMSGINPYIRVAIVTDRDLIRGLARMYEAYGYESPWEVQIFSELAPARVWAQESLQAAADGEEVSGGS